MSYILEALKKAQAERQLGSAPTIHAMPIEPVASARERSRSMPLLIGLGAIGLALTGTVAWWTQRTPPPPPVPGAVVLPDREMVPASPTAVVLVPTPAAPVPVTEAPRAPVASPPPVVARRAEPIAPKRVAQTLAPAAAPEPRAAASRATPPAAAEPAPEPAAAAPEESLPLASQLPESQRAGLPQLSFGGYMYSKNPADRLLLIDKVLRREGEEVAPGLILERLLPRAAVLNYRGTRYRVPY